MPKPLVHFGFNYPAAFGLNTQEQDESLDPKWATTAINFVFDQNGRLAARKGTKRVNASALTGDITVKTIHEYIDKGANSLIILTTDTKIYKVVGDVFTDITGTITTPTDGHWQFTNFNGACVGHQDGHNPIVMATVGGSFVDATGTQYSGSSVITAGGRLWTILGSDLRYSDLLINDFATGSAGVYDLSIYWKGGMDVPVAIAEFNGHLVVFGKNNIIVYSDVTSSATIVENISGIGCAARDSIQAIGNDLIFLSSKGVIALSRLIQEKSMPERDVSKNVRDYLLGYVNSSSGAQVKSSYNKKEGFYLLSFPNSNKVFHFDVRAALPDGSFRVTEWQTTFTSMTTTLLDTLLLGSEDGHVLSYQGYLDNALSGGTGGVGYTLDYFSPWNDFGQEAANYEKMVKRSSVHITGGYGYILSLKWKFDFDTSKTYSIIFPTEDGEWSEFGVGEYAIAEFGTGSSNREIKAPLKGSGRVMQIGLVTTTVGSEFGLQRVDVQAKLGKLNV